MEAAVGKPLIKVAALCGSLRKSSYHRAIPIFNESIPGMKIEFINIEDLPFVNEDLEVDGTYPPVVEAFRQKILEADSVLFASPEYNYSSLASRPLNVWADKPAAVISTGGNAGGSRSHYHLRQIGPMKFDAEGNLIHLESKEKLKKVLLSLKKFTHQLQDGK
ncbi:hypothetical protein MKX01_039165 [Papaver californicum]|nr:hypothetical protein MKX01_039165 [Papaver californicum]